MAEKKVYFNKPQRLTQLIGANTTVIVAGRRTGKTDSIAAPFVLRNMQRMPGSTGGIVVPTFKHTGLHEVGSSAVEHHSMLEIRDLFMLLCAAFNQPQYRVDKQLNVLTDAVSGVS